MGTLRAGVVTDRLSRSSFSSCSVLMESLSIWFFPIMTPSPNNVRPLDEARGTRVATSGCYATALSDSSERCIKDEIIQELGRALVLHGASTDYLSTVWSCGDTLPNEDVLGILADLNDKRLQRVKVSVEWATTLPQREQTAR